MITTDERLLVTKTMQKYGGSFVKKLGELIPLADDENLEKIKTTWPEYWEKYKNIRL